MDSSLVNKAPVWPDEPYVLNNLQVWLKFRNLDEYYSSIVFIVSLNFFFLRRYTPVEKTCIIDYWILGQMFT